MTKCKACGEKWIKEYRFKTYSECPYCGAPNDPQNPIIVLEKVSRAAFHAANDIRKFWVSVSDPDPWKNREMRQAYRDALECMKRHGLINDYSLDKIE